MLRIFQFSPCQPFTTTALLSLGMLWVPLVQASTTDGVSEIMTPIVSPHDARHYRILTLENGLQTLLVSDPQADKAAASMNIRVGSAQDPEDLQGLAHFLEHMLFLGTEPFPEPDAYQGYIARNAGSFNAFTAPQDTNYYFDIEPSALPGALDRFSAFFLSPLFNAEKLDSERNIVHSEYMARIRDESRRENDVLNQVLNAQHPMATFSVGSRETLADRPAGEPSLRDRVIEFYRQHYDANVMTLAVVAPQPLDTLEALVAKRFADIPNHNLSAAEITVPLVEEDSLPIYLERQSLQEHRQVRFHFPIPDPIDEYTTQPTQLISHLLGDEGEGSVLALLRDEGLADGLSAGVSRRDGNHAFFSISVSLTPDGAERLDDIQATLLAAMSNIRENGLAEWRYQEQANLREQAFRFQQPGAPSQEATRLSMNLSRYPAEDVQYAAYRMDGFNLERHLAYLNALTADNLIRVYSGPEVDSEQVSPWFDTAWRRTENPPSGNVLAGIALPAPNPFIAEDLTLQEGSDEQPQKLIDVRGFRAWHMQEDRFNTPKVEWRMSLQHPSASYSAEEAVLTRLLAGWLNDSLNESLYPAWLAGHSVNAYAHSRGMTLALSGWRDGQTPLIDQTLSQLASAPISANAFERVKYQLQRDWRNAPESSLTRQAQRALGEALLSPQWSSDELLAASQRLNIQHLDDFRRRFLDSLHVDVMAVGNLTAEQAHQQAERVRGQLRPRLTADAISELTPLQVNVGASVLRPDSTRDESLVLRYLQGNEASLRQQAAVSVLAQWLETPFYQRLRTEEQLGYIVNAGYSPLLEAPGLAMLVQSPETPSAAIAEHMDKLLSQTDERLSQLQDDALTPYRQAVHDRLTARDTRLEALANRHWQATALKEVSFNRRNERAELALDITVEELQKVWSSLRKRQLDIRFDPSDEKSDIKAFRDALAVFPQ